MKKLSKREWIASAVAIAFIIYMFFGNSVLDSFNNQTDQPAAVLGSDTSIKSQDVNLGTGPVVEKGMQVGVNYVLKLADGTVIQDSKQLNDGQPVNFIAGDQNGWETGILGARVGSKRVITIPPELGYGSQQVGPIPANSTLIFEIEIVSATRVAQ